VEKTFWACVAPYFLQRLQYVVYVFVIIFYILLHMFVSCSLEVHLLKRYSRCLYNLRHQTRTSVFKNSLQFLFNSAILSSFQMLRQFTLKYQNVMLLQW
jgi:hypothetical protein